MSFLIFFNSNYGLFIELFRFEASLYDFLNFFDKKKYIYIYIYILAALLAACNAEQPAGINILQKVTRPGTRIYDIFLLRLKRIKNGGNTGGFLFFFNQAQ